MKKPTKAKMPIKKIIGICLLLVFLMGIGVMASNSKLNNIKIILANGYEMDVVTAKTKVSDILAENHIILLPEENVIPNQEKELTENNTIRITKIAETTEVAKVNDNSLTTEDLLKSYDSIIEKIETVQEEIPFETITKDVSDGATTKKDTVIQQGRNGLREVTYKVKYQNDVEVERKEISSTIIKEVVDKIVEVRKQSVTSRSLGTPRTSASYNNGVWSYGGDEFDLLCAITAQECSSSYEGALAVITCACNRAERDSTDPLSEYKKPHQFCYSIDTNWKRRLNGNYSANVKKAVEDALGGKRNHDYMSFRAAGHASGEYIGGNVYF